MATVKAIKYGMKGDDVSKLQTYLKNAGYNIDVDGSFGPQTLAAVKQYQQANGLTVDGMVGPQTQAMLFGNGGSADPGANVSTPGSASIKSDVPVASTPAINPGASAPSTDPGATVTNTNSGKTSGANTGSGSATNPSSQVKYPDSFSYEDFTYDKYQSTGEVDKATANPFKYDEFKYDDYKSTGEVEKATENPFTYKDFTYGDFSYGDYQQSESVTQAQAALNAALASQPGAYQSKWQGQIDEMIGRILNREQFSYDINSDALYQQYADQYKNLGKLAMQDTMGQAAAMTGGYGSSYAQAAGQQAYQGYLSQLNEMIPELYGMALDQYNREGQEMYNQYGLLSDQEAQEYGRYQDAYNKWLSERDYATGRYESERNFDYGKYTDDRNFEYGKYADDRNFEYGKYSDDRNLAYNDYRNNIEDAKWKETDAYNKYINDRNFEYGKYADDKSYAYNDYINAIELAKWKETDAYNKYINDRNFNYGVYSDDRNLSYNEYLNAIQKAQWDAQFAETVKQNEIGNQQWQQNFDRGVYEFDTTMDYTKERDEVEDSKWETNRQDGKESEEKAYARADLEAIAASGGDATDEQLEAAGMSREAFEAMKAIASGDEESALKHVGAMSSKEIVDTLEAYASEGNNTAVEALLDDAFMTGRIDEATYLDWKKKYKRDKSHTITDTTVATPSRGSSSGSGGYGLAGFSPSYK
jgi:peptidoglycan hydrolase-like protein with peptidoglycan-binding domain